MTIRLTKKKKKGIKSKKIVELNEFLEKLLLFSLLIKIAHMHEQ